MTHPSEDNAIRAAMESLIENGLDGMGEAVRILLNPAYLMKPFHNLSDNLV